MHEMNNGTSHNQLAGYHSDADEIDLLDLWQILIKQKWIIIVVTLVCTGAAIVSALLLPREYRAEVVLLPPTAEMVEKLNVPDINKNIQGDEKYFFKVTEQDLYANLIKNIQSYSLQHQFFDENDLLRFVTNKDDSRPVDRVFAEEFRKKLAVKGIETNKVPKEFVTITLEGKEPNQIATWLNDFVRLADKTTIAELNQTFSVKVHRMKDSISRKIESLRNFERARRLDRIAALQEAHRIAKKIGLVEGPSNLGFMENQSETDDNYKDKKMSFILQTPLYLRGTKALQAEITALKERENDDPFIPRLRTLQQNLDFLSSIKQDVDNVHAMRLDRVAVADDRPVKPKRKLLVALGFVSGFILALFLAFFRNMLLVRLRDGDL